MCIGPARAADSYLNQDALLTVAKATGCDGLHPGYGFLSENADFADACAREGITFVGPSGDTIRKAGSKSAARELMKAAGVPVTPGSDGPVDTVEAALAAAERVGYPVLLKASAGGGGRGIRRCDGPEALPAAYAEAKAEAKACFGDNEMYLEKLVLWPRHIEFQVLADRFGNVIHLGDRDCSVQRRNQKLMEEAPARCLTPELRTAMGQAAVRAARAVGYENAGTVEFLLDADGEHFYFMEMNTRIQVEHGVTELITGVDLVRQQLRIASGLPLDLTQEDVTLTGHAIECRINAEDPSAGFRPSCGRITLLHIPVILGAALTGPVGGMVLGGVFGLTSFFQCFGLSTFGTTLFSINPAGTFIVCVIPRILLGLVAAYLYRAFDHLAGKWSGTITGALATICHTAMFMGTLAIFFYTSDYLQGFAAMMGTTNVFAFIIAFVGLQGLLEIILAAIVVGALIPVIKKARKA